MVDYNLESRYSILLLVMAYDGISTIRGLLLYSVERWIRRRLHLGMEISVGLHSGYVI